MYPSCVANICVQLMIDLHVLSRHEDISLALLATTYLLLGQTFDQIFARTIQKQYEICKIVLDPIES